MSNGDGSREIKEKAKLYQRLQIWLHIAGLGISAVFLIAVQLLGISGAIKNIAFGITHYFYPALAAYFFIFSMLSYIVTLPLEFYSGFILEHRFSLSNQTFPRWLSEEFKKSMVSFIIMLFVVEALYAIGRNFPATWWIAASVFWLAFSVGLAKLFPIIIMPLFYKYLPLANDDLKRRVFELAGKFGLRIIDVSEVDFSKNTRKSNAAVVGWGKTRRVVLADNLVNEFTPDEVEVVVAHEMAHYKLGHIQKLVVINTISTIAFFYLLSLTLSATASFLGASGAFDMSIFPVILLLFGLYSFLLTPLMNAYSRKLERDADKEAIRITGNTAAFISLMKRLAEKNLADEAPHPLVEILFYNHPPISKRIRMGEEYGKK